MAKRKAKAQTGDSYLVVQRFKAKSGDVFEVGDDVSHFNVDRLDGLVKRGLVALGSLPEVTDQDSPELDDATDADDQNPED